MDRREGARRELNHQHGDASALAAAIESQHPDPFRAVDRGALLREAKRIDAVDTGDRCVHAIELMRMIAMLGPRNGHTVIDPLGQDPEKFDAFPLGLYEFDDGIFVVDAERHDLIGAELVALDGADVNEVLRAVAPLIAHDNEWTVRARRPTFVISVQVLRGLGVVSQQRKATFRLRSRNGSIVELQLDASPTSELFDHLRGNHTVKFSQRADLRHLREWHWTEPTAGGRAIHVGYNLTLGDITPFALEIEARAHPPRIGLVVLDLRHNGGGDNRTYRPLLETLQRLGDTKRLAVLTSRATFSAAMQLVVDLERSTEAVFLGEPTGGSPNQYGDATPIVLPSSGLNVFVATIAWMTAGELDERITREPDLPIANESLPFFAGDDPVLDNAIAALS